MGGYAEHVLRSGRDLSMFMLVIGGKGLFERSVLKLKTT